MVSSKAQACGILGISLGASESEIKTAYRALIKLYHPDEAGNVTLESYHEVQEAYDFLMKGTSNVSSSQSAPIRHHHTYGTPMASGGKSASAQKRTPASRYAANQSSAADYERFQKRYNEAQVAKKAAFEKKAADFTAKKKKEEDDFKRAMEAIECIRAAWALEAWIEAGRKEKDKK